MHGFGRLRYVCLEAMLSMGFSHCTPYRAGVEYDCFFLHCVCPERPTEVTIRFHTFIMKENHIFPDIVINQSVEVFAKEKSITGEVIYWTVLLSIIISIVGIAYIDIDVSVNSSGVIKPEENHTIILATANGYVENLRLSQNLRIEKGDTLLTIRARQITAELPKLEARKKELESLTEDLAQLVSKDPKLIVPRSPLYSMDLIYYLSKLNEVQTKLNQETLTYKRSVKLHDLKAISDSEYESAVFEYTQAQNEVKTLEDSQKRQWQSDLIAYQTEWNDVCSQISQISIQDASTVILSPINGTIQLNQTLFAESYVQTGQQLAEISPDGNLIAECYLPPKDIGYIQIGMPVTVQVSSFNYNDWGSLKGTVVEVFDDVTVTSDGMNSYYTVISTLDSDHLSLKNGYNGYIKKGMVINANFLITRRTLFQLLYDKIDNWLNPNIANQHEEVD